MAISRLRELRLPWTQQPQEAVTVDRDHPLGGALDALWLPDSTAPVDVIGGIRSSGAPAGVVLGSAPEGRAILGSTSAGTAFPIRPRNTYPHVLVAYGVMDANNGWVLSYMTGDGGESILSVLSTGEVKYGPRRNYGTARSLKSTPTYAAGTPLCVIVQVFSDTDYRLYTNGSQANGTLSFGTGGTWLNSMGPMGARLSGRISLLGWGFGVEALTDAQALAITANPQQELWRMFEPQRVLVPVAAGGGSGPVGLATEADTALALAGVESRAAGLASEADTALALGAVQVRATGLATETDTALALAAVQIRPVGLAVETDTALALSAGGALGVGLATETDSALALGALQSRAVGLASETDTALALAPVMARPVGLATTTETALGLGLAMGVGLAVEVDTALAPGLAEQDPTQPAVPAPAPPGGGGHSLGSVQRIAISRERDPEELRLLQLRQDDEALMRMLRGLFDSGAFNNEIEELA